MTRVVYWHGDVNRDEVVRVLRDLRFVSETYGLVIPASMSRRALADLAILISLWACADRGVNGMFGALGSDAAPPPSRAASAARSASDHLTVTESFAPAPSRSNDAPRLATTVDRLWSSRGPSRVDQSTSNALPRMQTWIESAVLSPSVIVTLPQRSSISFSAK